MEDKTITIESIGAFILDNGNIRIVLLDVKCNVLGFIDFEIEDFKEVIKILQTVSE